MKITFSFILAIERGGKVKVLSRPSWERLRGQVRELHGETCYYCGKHVPEGHVDHVIPLSKGGTDDPDNLVWACAACNQRKGARLTIPRILTPQIIAKITDSIIKQHAGLWSRKRLMGLEFLGEPRITRSMYETATTLLLEAGALQETTQGGYQLRPSIKTSEDLAFYPFESAERLAREEMENA